MFTKSQYSGLESLYRKYKDRGFHILGFPANNFLRQEPGTNAEIKAFCERIDVTFELFAKVSVKGADQCPLYRFLTTYPDKDIAGKVTWNFQKYLIDRNGKVIAKWGPRTSPTDAKLIHAVDGALTAKGS